MYLYYLNLFQFYRIPKKISIVRKKLKIIFPLKSDAIVFPKIS